MDYGFYQTLGGLPLYILQDIYMICKRNLEFGIRNSVFYVYVQVYYQKNGDE